LIHHIAAGAGAPPVVLVHGFGCSHTDWAAQVQHFSARHRCVAVDLAGHGATPAPAEPPSIESCGADVAGLLQSQALPPAILVGHSMGCRVVLEAALRSPQHAAGVVLVDGSQFAPEAQQAFESRFAAGDYKALVRDLFTQMFTPRSDAAVVVSALERALALPEAVGQALLLSLVRYDQAKLATALVELRKPLMVLQTTFVNDRRERQPLAAGQTTPYLDFIRAKVPAARIDVIEGIGHFPQLDAAAETNRRLAAFIATLA
jgi:pimeloyl-ACP methyl ester carboxylesterase